MIKILIIDDDPDIRLLLSRFLEKEGYETDQAASSSEAQRLLKAGPFDLVLCDFKLPDDNGIDLIKRIKILNQHCQIIMITGYSDVKTAVQAMRLGAHDYVTKPLYPDEFLHIVKEALNKKIPPGPNPLAKRNSSMESVTRPNRYKSTSNLLLPPTCP